MKNSLTDLDSPDIVYSEWELHVAGMVSRGDTIKINGFVRIEPAVRAGFKAPCIVVGGVSVTFSIERLREILWALFRTTVESEMCHRRDEYYCHRTAHT